MGIIKKKTKKFSGTIIIGDPCGMVKNQDDWLDSDCGERFDLLGFETYLWIEFEEFAPIVKDGKNKVLGRFCTDSALVTVTLLDELLKYYPEFDQHITHPENWTVIKGFKGTVISGKRFGKYFIKGKGNINFHTIYEDQ